MTPNRSVVAQEDPPADPTVMWTATPRRLGLRGRAPHGAGWRVTEHDVPYLPRTGASKVTGTWRGTWHAVRDMRGVLAEQPERRVPRDAARGENSW